MGWGISGGTSSNSSSSSSTSTNNSTTWNSQQVENFMNGFNPNIYYENEDFLDANPYLQEFLNYETSGQSIINARSAFETGEGIFKQGYGRLQKAAGISPADIWAAMEGGIKTVNGQLNGLMSNEYDAIQNQAMVSIGDNLAQNAETQNAGGAVAGSSAMNNSAMGIKEAGAESMESQESELAASILKGSVRAVNNFASAYARGESGITKSILGIGSDIMKGGINAMNKGASNYWNAAIFEQAMEQKSSDVNRKNNMINNNMGLLDEMVWLQTMLQTAGIDTTSTTKTTGSSSGSSSSVSGGMGGIL